MILNDSVTEWLYNQPDCSMKTAYYDIKTWKKCLDIRGEIWGKKYQRRIFPIISNWQEKTNQNKNKKGNGRTKRKVKPLQKKS